MKKFVVAALALTGFAGSAFAADMAARPVYKAPPPAPGFSWTGCYLGAGGGGAMSTSEDTTVVTATGVALAPQTDFGGRGGFGTVQGGCDYQFASSWVFGVFADYDFGRIESDASLPGLVGITGASLYGTERQNWSWAAGARLGWTPFDRLLTYVSAGYTQAHYRQTNYNEFGSGLFTGFTDGHTYDGWFVGTGYEYAIGWFPGLTWKTEYRFADYGGDRLTVFDSTGATTAFSVDREKFVHTVRSELVWRFNWPY
jgi:outer membrane immunogenic protein